jgi:hypothetical protein
LVSRFVSVNHSIPKISAIRASVQSGTSKLHGGFRVTLDTVACPYIYGPCLMVLQRARRIGWYRTEQRRLTAPFQGTFEIPFALLRNIPGFLLMEAQVIRKISSGQYRLYSRKKNPKTGRRRNLGTFRTRKAAEAHERAVQYFKGH